MSNPSSQFANKESMPKVRRLRRSSMRGWLRIAAVLVFVFMAVSMLAQSSDRAVEAAGPPMVDGLFY
jgi:hypothetical protein